MAVRAIEYAVHDVVQTLQPFEAVVHYKDFRLMLSNGNYLDESKTANVRNCRLVGYHALTLQGQRARDLYVLSTRTTAKLTTLKSRKLLKNPNHKKK